VPTYDQLAGTRGASLPELRLDLHVFANEPADRFIFLNNKRLREGEALPDGTRVESIVPDGAVLAVRGMRFLLQRQ
jgi:general secretion pathway protein B